MNTIESTSPIVITRIPLVPVVVNGQRWWSDKARTVAAATKREVMTKIARRYAGGGK